MLVVLVAVVLGLVRWHGGTSTRAAGPADPAAATPPATVATLPAQSPVGRVTPDPRPDWPAALRSLDRTRARAFASRDSTLLTRVYVPGPLRVADAASLVRLVPPGCGLQGVHTDYSAVTSRDAAGTVVLTARATLPASRLVCSGQVVRTAAAVGPTRLRITLVRRNGLTLIAAERALT